MENQNELSTGEQVAVKLSNDHWGYIRKVLAHDGVREEEIERILCR